MAYTAKDLVRAYKQRAVHGSITANAKKMGITGEALHSLFHSLDRSNPKFLKKTTKQAWHMLHDKRLTVDEHVENINKARAIVETPRPLEEIMEIFQTDIANFIERAVESACRNRIQERDARITELERKIVDYEIIAEVARKENRFASLTKRFFHED